MGDIHKFSDFVRKYLTLWGRVDIISAVPLCEVCHETGSRPICRPVSVTGQVRNMAGALVLTARAHTTLSLICDRCAKPFDREKTVEYETLLADRLEGEDEEEIVLLDGDELDVGRLMTDTFILEMDTKNLCSEDCKGLCPGCGADLNTEPCRCQREVDPRLAGLAKFFEKDE